MANDKTTSVGQQSAAKFELIPAPAGGGQGGAGNWSQAAVGGFDAHNGSGNLSRYLHALRRRWLMAVIVAPPITSPPAWAVWPYMPRLYTATAILRLSPGEKALLFPTVDGSNVNANAFDTYKRTQRQLLRSRFVITPALRDELLAKVPVLVDQDDPDEWLE